MCFRPQVNNKLLLQLEQQRDALEQQNSELRSKLEVAVSKNAQFISEKQAWSHLRMSLETSCSEKTRVLVSVLANTSQLSSQLENYLKEHQAQQKLASEAASSLISVHCHEESAMHGPSREGPCGALDRPARSVVPEEDGADEEVLPPEQRVERVMSSLAAQHEALLGACSALAVRLEHSRQEGRELSKDLAALRSQKEATETKAKAQQDVLEVRCNALESSNASLHDLNHDLQAELARLQKQLTSASEARSAGQEQAVRLRSDVEAAHARADAAESELRATQLIIVTTKEQMCGVERQLSEVRTRAEADAAQAAKLRATLIERDAELAALTAAHEDVRKQLTAVQRTMEQHAAEVSAARSAEAVALVRAMNAEGEAAEMRAALSLTRQQAASQTSELEAASRRLTEAKRNTVEMDAWLKKMENELAEAQHQASDANNQYLAVKKELVQTSQQLASIAKDHNKALDAVAGSGDALQVATSQLQEVREQLAAAKQDISALTSRAADGERAASAAAQELYAVSCASDALRAQLACKRALLAAIVKLCAHKAAGEASQDGSIAAYYNAALNEGCMRLRLCDVPLALLGSLAAGVADSGVLSKLVIDMDASREMVWEKAALRVAALAAALSLNTSLRSVELVGWSWDEAGSGLAAPFLTLGAAPGTAAVARGGGSYGGVGPAALLPPPPAFSCIQIDTRLFDASCASMLSDLLLRGLVDLMRPGGIGVVRLYTDHEALDEWYGECIQHAIALPDGSNGPARTARTSPRDILADLMPGGSTCGSSQYNGSTGSRYTSSVSAPGAPPSIASTMYNVRQLPPTSSISHAGALPGGTPLSARTASVAGSVGQHLQQLGAAGSMAGSVAGHAMSVTSTSSRAVSVAGSVRAAAAAPSSVAPIDCDLANEGLESHHMVLVMVVLQACTHVRRLRLDGNKIGDSGAEVLALGLSANTGLAELSLARNAVRRGGARKLARALETCTSLTKLDLGGQRYGGVGPQGTEALAAALRTSPSLTELELRENSIGPSGAAALATALRASNGLRRLGVAGNMLDAAAQRTLTAAAQARGTGFALMV